MSEFRQRLYKNYSENLRGKRSKEKLEEDFFHDKLVYLREILPHLPSTKDAAILELGSGYGSLLSVLKDDGYTNLKGVDLSPGQLDLARTMGIDSLVEKDALEFLRESAEQFDVIIAIDLVEHFNKEEQLRLLQGVYTHLKPGGLFIFRTPNADALRSSIFSAGDLTHEQILGNNSARQLCRAADFVDISVLPGYMRVSPYFKEVMRKLSWFLIKGYLKWQLFATGRSSKGIIFTPNILVKAYKETNT